MKQPRSAAKKRARDAFLDIVNIAPAQPVAKRNVLPASSFDKLRIRIGLS